MKINASGPNSNNLSYSHFLSRYRDFIFIVILFSASRAAWWVEYNFWISPDKWQEAFTTGLCHWDCGFYNSIAEHGYSTISQVRSLNNAEGLANWAFFPLHPLLIRGLMSVFTLSSNAAGIVEANFLALATLLLAKLYFKPDQRSFWIFSLIFCFGPFSFYFGSNQTESLFFFLSFLSIIFCSQKRFFWACIACSLAGTTRLAGLFLALMIFILIYENYLRDGPHRQNFFGWLFEQPKLLFGFEIAPLGALCFMAYLTWLVGDGLAFIHVQHAWGRHFENPLTWLRWSILSLDISPILRGSYSHFWNGCWGIISIILIGRMIYLKKYAFSAYAALCIIVPMSSGIMSIPRFAIGCIPIFLEFTALISKSRHTMYFLAPALLALSLWLTKIWFENGNLLV